MDCYKKGASASMFISKSILAASISLANCSNYSTTCYGSTGLPPILVIVMPDTSRLTLYPQIQFADALNDS